MRTLSSVFMLILTAVAMAACGSGGGGNDESGGAGFLNPGIPGGGAISRVSVSSAGDEANNQSSAPAISSDGKFVAYQSAATTLIPGGTNGLSHIFVHDITADTTTRISVSSGGAEGDGHSYAPAISANGSHVAFESRASNLVLNDTNTFRDIFVHELTPGTTDRISISSGGVEGNGDSFAPSVSADGMYVAFESNASNLVVNDINTFRDIFIRDLNANNTTRISISSGGAEGNGDSFAPSVSADGVYVAFESSASNLVAGDTNGRRDIFVRDRNSGTTTRVSVDSLGAEGNGDSSAPSISDNGRYVAFESAATNLVAGDTNGLKDIFVHDLNTGATVRVSVSSSGTEGNNQSSSPSLSGDGWHVAFQSTATNLISGFTTNGLSHIFSHDVTTGITVLISVTSVRGEGNGGSFSPSVDLDGNNIAFKSLASNLISDDTNGVRDIFVAGL